MEIADFFINCRYYIFFWGFVLIDVNDSLFYLYDYLFKLFILDLLGLHSVYSSVKFIFIYASKGLLTFLHIYDVAYSRLPFLILFFLFLIINVITASHFFFLYYIIQCLLVDFNLVIVIYKFCKRIILSFFQFFLILYFFLLSIILKFVVIINKYLLIIKKVFSWIFVKIYYLLLWSYEVWGEVFVEPFGGTINFKKRYLWTYPVWIYYAELIFKNIIILNKLHRLNLWCRIKLYHKKNLGLNEKKLWYFLTSWHLLYVLRYYYYFLFIFFVRKFFRLIYFFVIFFFKFFFYKLLKYCLEFNFIYNFIQIFLFYYINVIIYFRKFLSVFFYDFIIKLYAYFKSKFITFFLLEGNYLLYKFFVFFEPKNYSFLDRDKIEDYPYDISLKNLRRFFWFHYEHNAYEGNYFLTILRYQILFFICLYYLVNIVLVYLFEKNFEKKVEEALSFFSKKGLNLSALNKLKFNAIYIYYNIVLFKILWINQIFSPTKSLKKKNFLNIIIYTVLVIFFFFIAWFLLINLLKIFLIIIWNIFNISFFFEAIISFANRISNFLIYCNFFRFLNVYFLFFLLSLFSIKIANKKWFWQLILVFIDLFLWYLGFFAYLLYSLIISLLINFIKLILILKLWAWFLLIMLLAFDNFFFLHYFMEPVLYFLAFLTKLYVNFVDWFSPIICSTSKTIDFDMRVWLRVNKYYLPTFRSAAELSDSYTNKVMFYFNKVYWDNEYANYLNLYSLYKEDRATFIIIFIFIMINPAGEYGTFAAWSERPVLTFYYIPKDLILFIYYYIKNIIISHYKYICVFGFRDMILYDIVLIIRSFFIKTYLEWWWLFKGELPIFFNFFGLRGSYFNILNKFLNIWYFHYFLNLLFDWVSYFYNVLLCTLNIFLFYLDIFFFTWEYAFLACKYLILFMHDFFSLFDLSFALTNSLRKLEIYWFIKNQNALVFKDVYNTSFFRSNLYKFHQNILDKHPVDFFTNKYVNEHGLYIASIRMEQSFIANAMGHPNFLCNWSDLKMHKINNLLYFGLGKEDFFFQESNVVLSYFYRSIIIYLHISIVFLIFIYYIFFIYILGGNKKIDYSYYSKPYLWACAREGLLEEEGNFNWLNTFAFLDFFYSSGSLQRPLLYSQSNYDPDKNLNLAIDESTNYIYSYYRYYLTLSNLLSNFQLGNKPKPKNKFKYLKYQEKRLYEKLKKFHLKYSKNSMLWKKMREPFDYKALFHNKTYENFFFVLENYNWILSKFSEYEKINNNFFLNFVNFSYLGYIPLKSFKPEDAYYIQGKLTKLFSFFNCIDKGLLLNKGPGFLLHKDPGIDFLTYDKGSKKVYQSIEDPYLCQFIFGIIILDLPLLILTSIIYNAYFIVVPMYEPHEEVWNFLHLWLLGICESFDIFHNVIGFNVLNFFENPYSLPWETRGFFEVEDSVYFGEYQFIMPAKPLLSNFMKMPDYWVQSGSPFIRNDFIDRYYFSYCINSIANFFENQILSSSILYIKSPILLTFNIVKFCLIALIIFYYFLRKFLIINAKKTKFYIYIENSTSILDYLNKLPKIKSININNYYYKKKNS